MLYYFTYKQVVLYKISVQTTAVAIGSGLNILEGVVSPGGFETEQVTSVKRSSR